MTAVYMCIFCSQYSLLLWILRLIPVQYVIVWAISILSSPIKGWCAERIYSVIHCIHVYSAMCSCSSKVQHSGGHICWHLERMGNNYTSCWCRYLQKTHIFDRISQGRSDCVAVASWNRPYDGPYHRSGGKHDLSDQSRSKVCRRRVRTRVRCRGCRNKAT